MSIDLPSPVLEQVTTTVLTDVERNEVRILATELAGAAPGMIDDPQWLRAATRASNRLPQRVRDAIRFFRRDSGAAGALLVRNLPAFGHGLPPTPTVLNSVQRKATKPASTLAMVTLQLGEMIAFSAEKFGALVQDVVPVPGKEKFQGNAGSITLTMHVENAFHDNRPDYVALLCLRNDHENIAGLQTASVRHAMELLPRATLDVLNQPRFITEAPASFGDSGGTTSPHAVLEGSIDDPDVRVDFTSTFPLDNEAGAALVQFGTALVAVRQTVILEPGDLAIVDNRITLHGRTAFQPRYDGQDRWLHRTFAQVDMRRSRPQRPNDGNVLI